MNAFVTGLLFGAVGSTHCVAMCGPLVLTIDRTLRRPTRGARLQHAVCYHGARVLMYAGFGLVAGVFGQTLALLGFGRILAVAAGAVLLLVALGSVLPSRLQRFSAKPAAIAVRACGAAARVGRAHPIAGPVLAGAANGFLPCGLVYAAVLTATALGSVSGALAMMVGFGFGTIPALLAVSLTADSTMFGMRSRLRRLTPVLLAVTAVLLLARGLAPSFNGPSHSHAQHAVARP